jgi:hypothetical protein
VAVQGLRNAVARLKAKAEAIPRPVAKRNPEVGRALVKAILNTLKELDRHDKDGTPLSVEAMYMLHAHRHADSFADYLARMAEIHELLILEWQELELHEQLQEMKGGQDEGTVVAGDRTVISRTERPPGLCHACAEGRRGCPYDVVPGGACQRE